MKLHRVAEDTRRHARGSVLVEFAFICLAFYLLFAGTIELGRMITVSQIIQNAARVGARELALVALPPTMTFEQALQDPTVRDRIFDSRLLAVDVSGGEPNTNTWPIVNRMLYPVMVRSRIGSPTLAPNFLHFPGAVLRLPEGGFTVGVPHVISRGTDGVETIRWLPVLEEVKANPNDPNSGPYSLASTGPERGLVALRINYPYQATTLTAYRQEGGVSPSGTPVQRPVEAHDDQVSAVNPVPDNGEPQKIQPTGVGDPASLVGGYNTGPYGLGAFVAGGGDMVRPFRRLISVQSLFRREVFAQ